MPPNTHSTSRRVNLLDTAILLTEGLKELAASAPVPALSGVLGLTLHILKTAQRARTDRDACLRLATRAAEVAKEVHSASLGKEHLTDTVLEANLKKLKCTLTDIASWMENHGKRNFLSRIVRRGTVSEDLIDYLERLEDARHAFELASLINLQHKVEGLEQRLELERLYDGEHRIFRRSEIRKLQMLGQDLNTDGYGIVWCSARVQGEIVVLKEYIGKAEQYEADTKFLKKAWHENIAQLIGHSRADTETPFQVVRCGTRTAISYVETLGTGRHKTLEIARILCGIVNATAFLDQNSIGWEGWAHNVTLDDQGLTAIGGHGDLTPATSGIWRSHVLRFLLGNRGKHDSDEPAVITIYQLQERTSAFHQLLQDLFTRQASSLYLPEDALQVMSEFWSYWCNSIYVASYSGECLGDVGYRKDDVWVRLLSVCDEITETFDHPTTLTGNASKVEILPDCGTRSCWEHSCASAELQSTSDGTHFTENARERAWKFWLCNANQIAEENGVPLENLMLITGIKHNLHAIYKGPWSPPLEFLAHPAQPYGGRERPWGVWSMHCGMLHPNNDDSSFHETFTDEATVYFIHLLPEECDLLFDIAAEVPGIVCAANNRERGYLEEVPL